MPDLITIANDLKTAPDQWLLREAQNPTGPTPSFLVLSELQRRQLLRSGGAARQPSNSVAQDTVQNTIKQIAPPTPSGPPPPPGMAPVSGSPPSGAPGAPMPGAQPPGNTPMPPRGMQAGGSVDDDGGDYLGEMQNRPMSIPDLISASTARYGLPPNLVNTVAQMESNFNPKAQGPRTRTGERAQGVMQLMPSTGRSLGVTDPFDPAQNIDAGSRYLAQLYQQYGGDVPLTLAAYNAGPGAVHKYGGIPPYSQTQNYVTKGMKLIAGATAAPAVSQTGSASRSIAPTTEEGTEEEEEGTGEDGTQEEGTGEEGTGEEGTGEETGTEEGSGEAAPPQGATVVPATPAATGPGSSGLGAVWTPPEPANITAAKADVEAKRKRLAELTGQPAYDPMSALTADNIAKNKAAVEAILGPRPNYGNLESAVAQLQSQAQQSMHPDIWSSLRQLGFGLLASHSPYFGQAFGEAALGMESAQEKQRQEGRQQYIEALRAGVDLQGKKNAYDEKVADLNFSQIRAEQAAGTANQREMQKQADDARKELEKAQTGLTTAQTAYAKTLQPSQVQEVRAQGILTQNNITPDPSRPAFAQVRELVAQGKLPPSALEEMLAPPKAMTHEQAIALSQSPNAADAARGNAILKAEADELAKKTKAASDATLAREKVITDYRESLKKKDDQSNDAALQNVDKGGREPARKAALKVNTDFKNATQSANDIRTFIDQARSGNKEAYAYMPTAGVMAFNTQFGLKRINKTEIEQYGGAGSLWTQIESKLGKLAKGEPIPPDLLNDIEQLHNAIFDNARSGYEQSLGSINDVYHSNFKPLDTIPLPGGKVRVYAPDRTPHDFPNPQAAEDFKRAAGMTPVAAPGAKPGTAPAAVPGQRYQVGGREIALQPDGWHFLDNGQKVP